MKTYTREITVYNGKYSTGETRLKTETETLFQRKDSLGREYWVVSFGFKHGRFGPGRRISKNQAAYMLENCDFKEL